MSSIRSLAIVAPFYPPHVGGVERYTEGFAQAAAALGLRTNVICTDWIESPTETEESGIRVLTLPALNVPIMGSHFPIPTAGRRQMAAFLDCDAVLANTRFFLTTVAATIIQGTRRRQVAILDHGAGPLRTSPKVLALSAMIYERVVTSFLKLYRPKFFSVSAASAKWLQTFGVHNAPVLPNSVSVTAEMPVRSPIGTGKVVVFCASRLLAEKGILELVDGAELFAKKGHDVELRIAGDGPLSPTLANRKMAAGRLVRLGRISSLAVQQELRGATVFAYPSKLVEGLPTALLEAGSAGVPVLSTTFGGSGELLIAGQTGWALPFSTPEYIASCLEDIILQPAEAQRRSRNLFHLIQKGYTWPQTVKTFLSSVTSS